MNEAPSELSPYAEEYGIFLEITSGCFCRILTEKGVHRGKVRGKMMTNNKWSRHRLKPHDFIAIKYLGDNQYLILEIIREPTKVPNRQQLEAKYHELFEDYTG